MFSLSHIIKEIRMIPIYLEIPDKAKKIINKNVGYIFESLICACEGLSYKEILSDIYPSHMIESKPEKCERIIKEMYNMTQDSYEREFLKPIYEWTLFRSIMWWVDAIEGSSLDEIPREYCIDESGVDRYDFINDVENYIDFLFADWDFLNLSVIYSLYKKKPQVLKKFLHIDIEHYLELMPPDIEMDCKRMIEKNKKIKESKNSMIININSGQINIAQGNSKLNATQNNGTSGDELEKTIEEIRESLHNLNKEDAEKISDVIELAQQELVKSKPKVSRLRNCLTMFAPMFTIANGIPTLTDNLHKLQEIILSYLK